MCGERTKNKLGNISNHRQTSILSNSIEGLNFIPINKLSNFINQSIKHEIYLDFNTFKIGFKSNIVA